MSPSPRPRNAAYYPLSAHRQRSTPPVLRRPLLRLGHDLLPGQPRGDVAVAVAPSAPGPVNAASRPGGDAALPPAAAPPRGRAVGHGAAPAAARAGDRR